MNDCTKLTAEQRDKALKRLGKLELLKQGFDQLFDTDIILDDIYYGDDFYESMYKAGGALEEAVESFRRIIDEKTEYGLGK